MNPKLNINPGSLLQLGELLTIEADSPLNLTIYRLSGTQRSEIAKAVVGRDRVFRWQPPAAGGYLAVFHSQAGPDLQRYIGVVDRGWAVCQITVGAFTSEDFAAIVHPAGVPVDYYVVLPSGGPADGFAADDPRWRDYERRFGDAIHPHVMAADLGVIDGALAHDDPNWTTLSVNEIEHRLRALQAWWQQLGYAPLDRIATYTPCNRFVEACRRVGIRVLHSLVPEQNWSDGEWGINDWGMPNCPFWIAEDDYRKPARRTPDAVLGMSMNHYGVLPPHLTRWGDYVLSPSHFLRWNRATDSGPRPVRFEQFLRDTLGGWRSLSGEPSFFSAGFEFGRTFGTSKMTGYNALGLQRLIELSASEQLVFATSRDTRAYYDRHQPSHGESVFLQRDHWAGCTTNGKPAMAGDSLIIERASYKALIREGQLLPMFHYDYTTRWQFATADEDAPSDLAMDDESELRVIRENGELTLQADKPLSRAVPVAVWDASVRAAEPGASAVPVLEDGRRHTLLEVPAGWQGRRILKLTELPVVAQERPAWWLTQSFGEGESRHTYLHLDLKLIRDVTIPINLKRPAAVDAVQGPLGGQAAGRMELRVGPSATWHRFWAVDADALECTAETLAAVAALRPGSELLGANWCQEVNAHTRQLHEAMLTRTGLHPGQIALEVFCGANLPLGERCRAAPFDIVHRRVEELTANECGDGVLAQGPGKSFWYHPRGFPLRLSGMTKLKTASRIRLLLHSFDETGAASLRVTSPCHEATDWQLPKSPWDERAWLMLELDRHRAVAADRLNLRLQTIQEQLLHDWWAEGGFVARLHALWVVVD